MKVRWSANPAPGVQDDEPAEGVIEALDLEDALSELKAVYPPDEWALMVTEVHTAPPEGEPTHGG